jgi:hypothetical protein
MGLILRLVLIAVFIVIGERGVRAEKTVYEMGAYASYIRYREPGVMEQKGYMGGLYLGMTARPDGMERPWPDMYRFEGYWGMGEVDYTSENTGSIDGIDDLMLEGRYFAGYDIPVGEDLRLTPYAGIGYRYLRDDSSGMQSSTGHYGYKREANYLYIPLGVELNQPLSNGWEISWILELDFLLYGKQKSYLGDANPGLGLAKNDQDKGYGVRGSIRLSRQSEQFDWMVEPYVRWWDIDDSKVSTSCGPVWCVDGYEPKNDSIEAGARVGLIF